MFPYMYFIFLLTFAASAIIFSSTATKKPDGGFEVKSAGGCVSMLLLVISSIGTSVMTKVWAITTMWAWFVTPLFNIPVPNKPMAYGLMLFLGLVMPHSLPRSTKEDASEFVGSLLKPILYSWLLVFSGWIIQSFFL